MSVVCRPIWLRATVSYVVWTVVVTCVRVDRRAAVWPGRRWRRDMRDVGARARHGARRAHAAGIGVCAVHNPQYSIYDYTDYKL